MRLMFSLALAVFLISGSPLKVAAQVPGCWQCIQDQCTFINWAPDSPDVVGATGCENWGGTCVMDAASCCVGDCNGGPGDPVWALLDGTLSPLSVPQSIQAGSAPRSVPDLESGLVRICQGDVLVRNYSERHMDRIRETTRQLII